MATETTTITSVSGSGPYTLTLSDASNVATNDHVGAPTTSADGVYLVTGKSGNDVTVTDSLDPDGGTYGAPVAGVGFFGTPTSIGTTPIPYGAKNWNAASLRNERRGPSIDEGLFQARLSLDSSSAVAEASGAATLYLHRFQGKKIALFDGTSTWDEHDVASAGVSFALSGATASKPHDVFVYDNSGTLTLDLVVWTNDTTRATALATQDGVYVKSGATERRYVGTVYVDSSNQASDSASGLKFDLWNYYNRIRRCLKVAINSGSTWTHAANGTRKANNSTAADVTVVKGVDDLDHARFLFSTGATNVAATSEQFQIGKNGTTAWSESTYTYVNNSEIVPASAEGEGPCGVGRNTFSPIETHAGAGTNTMGGSGSFHCFTWQ